MLGLLSLTLGLVLPPRFFYKNGYALLGLSVLLLIFVMIPGIGHRAGGATRWISLGAFKIQVGEIVKLGLISYLAMSLAKKSGQMHLFQIGLVPHL